MGSVGNRQYALLLLFASICASPRSAHADVGLIVETPTGLLGFLSNVGHVSVWISHGCLSPLGTILFCENSAGLVLTSTAYWPNPGAAAIPAELFFLGTKRGIEGRDRAAWVATEGETYPDVQPAIGAKYMGRAWLRSLRVLKFATSADEDRRVLAEINESQRSYRYSYSQRNCAFYAQSILQHYFGPGFHSNRFLELGIDTPRALERALQHRLQQQSIEYRTIRFKGRLRHAWRQPPRNICESAVLDPKYAVPLLIYQPYLYVGFAGCYAAIRFSTAVRDHHPLPAPASPVAFASATPRDPQLQSYELLTGRSALQFSTLESSTRGITLHAAQQQISGSPAEQ